MRSHVGVAVDAVRDEVVEVVRFVAQATRRQVSHYIPVCLVVGHAVAAGPAGLAAGLAMFSVLQLFDLGVLI